MDRYGWARFPETTERIAYGRFRNVYLYITEECQLRCGHCYMGERLERQTVMPFAEIQRNLEFWRKMGGSKLTVLGGEATLHPDFAETILSAQKIGYEKIILTTNGLASARRKLQALNAGDFSYIQVSLDGGSAQSHDAIRSNGTFDQAIKTITNLCDRGFDTRIICTVNKLNIGDCLELLPLADQLGVSLVKFHVFSGIGYGAANEEWLITPPQWLDFCQLLDQEKDKWKAQLWYQPTYALRDDLPKFAAQGYQGCVGRTLDRISIFPDGRAYVCSYLFDTNLNFAMIEGGRLSLNRGRNELELFSGALTEASCGSCKSPTTCMGGCPAEQVVMGQSSCSACSDILPICRLWKSDI